MCGAIPPLSHTSSWRGTYLRLGRNLPGLYFGRSNASFPFDSKTTGEDDGGPHCRDTHEAVLITIKQPDPSQTSPETN